MSAIALPPNDQPPAWFMPFWLGKIGWHWDGWRFEIELEFHRVSLAERLGLGWSWRVEHKCEPVQSAPARPRGVVSIGGIGCRTAREARRDCLAVFWSDLWDGGGEYEQWRSRNALRPALVQRPAIIAERIRWAAEIEASETAKRRTEA